MSDQQENLERVSTRIGAAILEFFSNAPNEFFAEQLRDFVRFKVGLVAPGSPDRIMRDMRKRGVIDYKVLSRAKSLYLIVRGGQGRLF